MENYTGWPYLVIAKHAADLNQDEPFPEMAKYGDDQIERIGRIIRELARLKPGRPFFLGAQKCGELVGENEYFGRIVLNLFVRDGLLTYVGKSGGGYNTREYQFTESP